MNHEITMDVVVSKTEFKAIFGESYWWHRVKQRAISGLIWMAGFLPDEGDAMVGQWVCGNITTDKGTNLDLILFTNASPGQNITAATLTQPTGTGYAAISLVDGTWSGAADTRSYALQTFTAGAGGWTGSVQGYAVLSKGTTPRITGIEIDPFGPYTFAENDTYDVTLNFTTA